MFKFHQGLTHASSKSAEMAALQAILLLNQEQFSPFVYTDFDAVGDSSSSAAIAIAFCKANINRPACMSK